MLPGKSVVSDMVATRIRIVGDADAVAAGMPNLASPVELAAIE
jgi:hypothetical protein